jgi:hypothetical protein
VVGEAPGREEDRVREPFMGPAGGLMSACCPMSGSTWTGWHGATSYRAGLTGYRHS